MRIRQAIVFLLISAGLADPAAAQTEPQTRQISVRAVGGFMGFSEGFCENPGGAYDWKSATGKTARRVQTDLNPCLSKAVNEHARWLGGAIGAAKLLEGRIISDDHWLVIPANNRPAGDNAVFLKYLQKMRADAIGVGPEDFDLLLRGPGATAQRVVDWVRANPQLPLVATNVAVRTTRRDDDHDTADDVEGFSLHGGGGDDRTIGWNESLTLHLPDARVPALKLTESRDCNAAPEKRDRVDVGPGTPSDRHLPLKVPGGFRPDMCYWLTVAGPNGDVVFRFQTDAALTPPAPPQEQAARHPLDHFAVVTHPGAQQNVVVVSLIDPETRKTVREKAWTWQPSPASEERREIVFLDPAEALAQIVERATVKRADGKLKTPPIVILLSALSDEQTRGILGAFPEIRFAVLAPESELLGRAERRTDDQPRKPLKYSGDLGFVGVLDELYPQVARFLMRPEWVGETLVSVTAVVAPARAERIADERILWNFSDFTTDVELVPGAPLDWRQGSGEDWVYVAKDPADATTVVETLATEKRYRNCASEDQYGCKAFYAVWKPDGLAPVAGMSLRRRLRTDMAVVSSGFADPDFRLWVEDRILHENTSASWISPYILKRLLFASPRMVRAFVAGSDLPGVLQKIVAKDEGYCVSGLGEGCRRPGKDHPERLEINGRRLDPRLYYSIVLPDALAESLELQHDDEEDVIDLLETTDLYLRAAHATEASLARRYRGYFAIPTLSAGVTRTNPSNENPGIRANLPIAFSGAKETRTWTFALDADLAPWDGVKWAVRIPMTLNYEQKKQVDTISYGKDDFSLGARLDRKFRFFAGELRAFGGAFADGPLRDHVESLTASVSETAGGFTTSTSAVDPTVYTVEPNRYKHIAGGVDVLGLRQFPLGAWKMTLSNVGARLTSGYLTRAPYGVAIDGNPLDGELRRKFLSEGPAKALNAYFTANRSTFSPTTTFEVLTKKFDQKRVQIDLALSGSRTSGPRTYKADFTFQYRHHYYDKEDLSDLILLHRTQKCELKFATPVWRRLTITPNVSYQRATIVGVMPDGGKYPPFYLWSADVSAAFPISVRWGQGRLFR